MVLVLKLKNLASLVMDLSDNFEGNNQKFIELVFIGHNISNHIYTFQIPTPTSRMSEVEEQGPILAAPHYYWGACIVCTKTARPGKPLKRCSR